MDSLFVRALPKSGDTFLVDFQSLETLFVFNLVKTDKIALFIKPDETPPPRPSSDPLFEVALTDFEYTLISEAPTVANYCQWPVIVRDRRVLAGLCSVLRQLVRYDDVMKVLLGFRESCLLACAETSVWTNFCEVEIIETTKKIVNGIYTNDGELTVPESLAKFEHHMKRPVRSHNVYKLAREKSGNKRIKSSVALECLGLDHEFSEGTEPTLADVVLYPCFEIFFRKYPLNFLDQILPLTIAWYRKISRIYDGKLDFVAPLPQTNLSNVKLPEFTPGSLYMGEAAGSRSSKRAFTKQHVLDEAFDKLSIQVRNDNKSFGRDVRFDWSEIPTEADPVGGALPQSRADRKRDQLESLLRAVAEVAGDRKCRIVDFCSGSGHLGILLAVFLKECEVILVENKERSLARAEERILRLGLDNVTIVQSNLDYFQAPFDIGVCLHACGSATDLVIASCVRSGAHFVACPCCYGSIRSCPLVAYPRSEAFRSSGLSYETYLSLAHAADQTHDGDNAKTLQGYRCMDIVDNDRAEYGREMGYEVRLGKLSPPSCTNKNNLLIGVRM